MNAERFELSRHECVALLRATTIGRLCFLDHGCPLAFPINYRIDGPDSHARVVVRTAPETLMGRYEGLAALEIDEIDLTSGSAWSVVVRGRLGRVVGTHQLADPEPLVGQSRHRWLVLEPTAISGRRFTVSPAADGYSVDWQVAVG